MDTCTCIIHCKSGKFRSYFISRKDYCRNYSRCFEFANNTSALTSLAQRDIFTKVLYSRMKSIANIRENKTRANVSRFSIRICTDIIAPFCSKYGH